MVVLKLLIDGVDRTANMVENGWTIDESDGGLLDVCEIELEDPTNSITITEIKT